MKRILVLAALAGLLVPVTAPARSQRSSTRVPAIQGALRTAARGTVRHAGGWGWTTPALIVGANLVLGSVGSEPGEDRFALLTQPRFWGGVVGSLAASHLAAVMAAGMPGGPFVRTAVAMAGGFLGWELGSLNVFETDWLSLGAQIVVSSLAYRAVQLATGSVGFMAGGAPAMAAAVGAAIVTGVVLDRLRKKSLDAPLSPSGSAGGPDHDRKAPGPAAPRSSAPGLLAGDLTGPRRRWQEALSSFQADPSARNHQVLAVAEAAYREALAQARGEATR